ncbi:immunoglobulin-like domain-containing protein [Demequina sp. SO4-13]|uniref:immunoglobulin-like domain-containing protein n=1 Tax=Demequina sp. SO4-13 TaxID=3401027 RepID=UPI003AF9DB6C
MKTTLPTRSAPRIVSSALVASLAFAAVGVAGSAASASLLDPLSDDVALHYDFSAIDGTTIADKSGNAFDGTVNGAGATIVDDAIELTNDTFVEIPGAVFEGNDTLTISAWLRNDMPAGGNYAALYFGTADAPPSQYWLLNPANPDGDIKSVFTDGLTTNNQPWTTEADNTGPASVEGFALYTTVITPTSMTNYLDGELTGSTPLTHTVTEFGTGLLSYIGLTPYADAYDPDSGFNDPVWEGAVRDLKVYTAAMTDQQAAAQYYEELGDPAASQTAVDEDAAALAVASPVETDVVLPTAGDNGSEITWTSSHPALIAPNGTVTQPSADTVVTLTADLALGDATAQETFDVTVTGDGSAPLVARYDFTDAIDDNTIDDLSGNDFDATVAGTGATVDTAAGVLTLPGGASGSGAGYVSIPADVFENRDTLTISTWLRNRTGSGNYAAMFFGKAASTPLQYWLLNPKNPDGRFKTVMTDGNPTASPWSTEAGITTGNSSTAPERVQGPISPVNEWMQATTVITPTSLSGYLNGELIGTVDVTRTVSDFGTDLVAYLGRSSYPDIFFNGDFRSVSVYEGALTDEDIAEDYWMTAGDEVVDAALVAGADAIDLDGTSVKTDVTLPLEGDSGSQVTWASSDEGVIGTDGTVVRPAIDNATVTLTATFELAGRTYVRDYEVTVIADTPEADLAYEASVFDLGVSVLWDDITLADALGESISIAWASSDENAVSTDGVVTRGAAEQDVTLTATFSNAETSVERQFDVTVLAEVDGYLGSYIRSPRNNDDTASVHLALSEDGSTFKALNDNKGVLFPSAADVRSDVNREITSPTVFHNPDGGYKLLATIPGTTANDAYVYDTDDLSTYENQTRVTFAPGTAGVTRVEVEYDNGIGAYRLLYTAGDIDYEVTTEDFSSFTAPLESATAPSFTSGTFPADALDTDSIGITAAEYDKIAVDLLLDRVRSTSVDPFAPVTVTAGDDSALPGSGMVNYTSGEQVEMGVQWDDVPTTPGTHTVNGTVQAPLYTTDMDWLAEKRADPDVTVGDDGMYYLTGSYPMFRSGDPDGYDRVVLRSAETLEGLNAAAANEATIWHEEDHAGFNAYVWAPELAKIGDDWYILFTTSRNTSVWDKQPALLKYTGGEFAGDGPLLAENWETVGYIEPTATDSTAFSGNFALDMTHFEHNGTDYMVWADKFALSTMRMASVDTDNPLQLTSDSILITEPEHAWEIESESGTPVNEGAAVLKHDGKIFISFSSSAVNASYNISFLWADEDADLLDPASWHKAQYPYFGTGDVAGMYGMGHNSFTVDEFGNPVIVYHARSTADTDLPAGSATDGGLFDPRRNAHAKLVHFNSNGMPILDMSQEEELDPAIADAQIEVTVEGVAAPELESIAVTQLPSKSEYVVGDDLDLDGLEVTGTWTDSTTEVLTSDEFTVSGFDSSVAATVMVSVTSTDDASITTSFTVTVSEPAPVEFADVDESLEHYDSIMWLADRGITQGWVVDGETQFRPFNKITRDAMATFLYRYAGSPDVTLPAQSPFVDVDGSSEHYEAIVWLAQEGISEGWDTNAGQEFRPFEPITRDAMAAFLYRMAGEPAWVDPVNSPFVDITSTNTEFYTEITWLEDTGITTGWQTDEGTKYLPYRSTTRDAMAAFLNRYDNLQG